MKQLTTFAFMFLFVTSIGLAFSGNGAGTEADPYQITNVEQLQEMNDELDAHYILINDIDARDTWEWNEGKGFDPIGVWSSNTPVRYFTGKLDGQNYTISRLYTNRPTQYYVGLFGCLGNGSFVHNVNVLDATVIGHWFVGIFVGATIAYSKNSEILIMNCSSSGYVSGDQCVGGFCGLNLAGNNGCTASINNCYSNGDANGDNRIGGFCGENYAQSGTASSSISDCYSTGDVSGDNMTGGFCGSNFAQFGTTKVTISNCYSTGNTRGNGSVGGFCALNWAHLGTASVLGCYSTGDTKGNGIESNLIGGFCGANYAYFGIVRIINCYSIGNVIFAGDNPLDIGGFCGKNGINNNPASANIEKCYSIGTVIGIDNYMGFCGSQDIDAGINSCYWDTQTSGMTNSNGGEGRTTAEMKTQATFLDWDFNEIWCMAENQTYPQLQYFVDCDNLISVEETFQSSGITKINAIPNPFSQSTVIKYAIDNPASVVINIYNTLGNKISTLVDEYKDIGEHKAIFKAEGLPAGMYYYTIQIGEQIENGKLLLIR